MADEIATIISSLGLSNEAFLAIVLLAFVVIGAIIVIVATRPILDVYPYLHPNARVRARKGRLFDDKQISELVEANNVEEITNYLRGSPDYAEYLDNYTLEKALDIQLGETYDLVSRMAPKEIQSSFKVMAKKSDIANIKSLLTAKEAGLSQEATEELLVPTGSLYEDLQRLSDVDTVTDVVAGLDGTEYAPILEEVEAEQEDLNLLERTATLLTVNDFPALLSRNNITALLVFSVMFGAAVRMSAEKEKKLKNFLLFPMLLTLLFHAFTHTLICARTKIPLWQNT